MYFGADLSYVNEVEANGGVYYSNGQAQDPFLIFKNHGLNIVRVRLWHTPDDWTAYSNLADVERTIQRAKDHDLHVLLNFHYSDTWADPAKQFIPAAWRHFNKLEDLADALYRYTLDTLLHLHGKGLMPEFVQVGNEINTEILMHEAHDGEEIRWERNATLLNAAIRGVRDAGTQTQTAPQVMLHIAQPEFLVWWFDAALEAGVRDFDLIGLSYYPKWSKHSIPEMGQIVADVRQRYGKDLMLVEVAYPWTHELCHAESHLLGEDADLPDYPTTPQGQRDFLIAVTQTLIDNGAIGVIYWEPAWISTLEKPSIWENAALFDYQNQVHEGMTFMQHRYTLPVQD